MSTTPVLTLTTKAKTAPATVVIDGKAYPLRPAASLGLRAQQFQRSAKRMIEIETNLAPTPEMNDEYTLHAKLAAGIVLDAPASVLNKLDVGHLVAIVSAYVEHSNPSVKTAAKR